jgi:ketosteroid isomerase-like protein
MAFVRADALILANGKARSRNIDYFTLVKLDGRWKFLSASYVATPPADAEAITDEVAVLAAEDAWIRAEIDGDEVALRQVIDGAFRANSSNGTTGGKEDLVNAVLGFDMTNQEITERSIVVSGDTAVVFGTAELFFATDDGGETSSLLRYTTTWIRRDGQWRAIALHMSPRAQPE